MSCKEWLGLHLSDGGLLTAGVLEEAQGTWQTTGHRCALCCLSFPFSSLYFSLSLQSHFSKLMLKKNSLDPPAFATQMLGLPKHSTAPFLCSVGHKTRTMSGRKTWASCMLGKHCASCTASLARAFLSYKVTRI